MPPAATRRPLLLTGLFTGFLAFAPPPLHGQPPGGEGGPQAGDGLLRDLSLEQLGAVPVTSVSKVPQDLWQVPAAMWVITAADIRRSGATSLPEVLRMAPGVEVAGIDASHWSVGIRGFGDQFSKPLLVLLDGRNIYTPLFAGTYWPAHDIPLHDIDRIEVIRGAGGVIWGGNAVTGVINIITRRAQDTRGGIVSVGGGSSEHAGVFVRHGGGSEDGAAWRGYGRGFLRGPGHHAAGATDFDDDWWVAQAGFRADWPLGAAGSVTLQGEINDGRHGQRVQISTFSPPARQYLDGLVSTSGGYFVARLEQEVSSGTIRAQLSYDHLAWDAPHFAETRDAVDIDYVQTLRLGSRHGLTFGGGTRWSPGRFTQQIPTLTFTPAYHAERLHSLFVQDEVQLVPARLALTGGLKAEYNTYSGIEWLPTARLAWMPHPRQTFWAAATRAVRTPSRIERDISVTSLLAPPFFSEVNGSDSFEAEVAISYEAGYRVLVTRRLSLFLSAFHTEHDDLAGLRLGRISVETTPPPIHGVFRFPYFNGIKGQSTGGEIVPEWRPVAGWRLRGWYAYRRFDFSSKPGNVDLAGIARLEGASPANQGRVESRVTLPAGWEIDAAYRHVGRLKALGIGSYRTADLRLGWQATPDITLSLSGHNLFEPHHREFVHVPGTRVGMARRVQAALTWTYGTP